MTGTWEPQRRDWTMTELSHYDEAKEALRRAESGVAEDPLDLAAGQLHALLAVADELRNVHNELMEIRRLATAAG
jgi:hypothetical protein